MDRPIRKNNSVLDEIIASQTSQNIEEIDPEKIVLQLIKSLPTRTQDIVKKRFGLVDKRRETLEEIGKQYGITRERVRQIEYSTVNELRKGERLKYLSPVEKIVELLLEEHGKIMEHNLLMQVFVERINREINQNILEFIMELSNRFDRHDENENIRKAWSLKEFDLALTNQVIETFRNILQQQNKPIHHEELEAHFKGAKEAFDFPVNLSNRVLASYLRISKGILKNPFDEWGLVHWSQIIPKGVKDKAYLVLNKNNDPLHFTDITERINKSGFDHRKAVPQTVHNELIKDGRFVLVGRGIYALKEWGYKEGTVADVIYEILEKEEKPLSREEIIEKVLDQRLVKKNTIILALQDKNKFQKIGKDKYTSVKR